MEIEVPKKTIWIIVGVAAGVFIIAGGAWALFKGQQNSASENPKISTVLPTVAVENIKSYKDPLGFSFDYPESLTLNNHPEDQTNYANVELTLKGGSMRFLVSDTTYKDVNDWLKIDPEVKLANFLDSKLGGLEAKKAYLDLDKKVVIGTLWDGMMFKVEITPSDNQEVVAASEKILNSLIVPEKAKYADESNNGSAGNQDYTGDAGDEELVE